MNRIVTVITLLGIVASALAGGGDSALALRRADEKLRAGQRSAALALLQGIVAENPGMVEAHVLYQDVMRAAGKDADLLETYRARRAEAPDDPTARYLYARLLSGGRAVSELRQVVRDAPDFALAWTDYARALRHAGKLEKAEEAARRAVALDAASPGAHDALGWVLERRGDLEGAERSYREALQRDERFLKARFKLAHLLARTERGEEALEEIARAAADAPGEPQVFVHKGLVLGALGRHAEAAQAYAAAVAGAPQDPLVLVLLAESYAELSEWDLGANAARRALEREPKLAAAHAALGYIALRRDDSAGALASYKTAARYEPRNATYQYYEGLVHERRDDWNGAVRCYRAAIARDRDHPGYRLALGGAYEKLGKLRSALAAYKEAVRLAPEDVQAWARYGHTAADGRKPKLAIEAFTKANELDPEDTGVLLSLGVLYETGVRKPDKAAECYRKYLAAGGKDERVRRWLDALEKADGK